MASLGEDVSAIFEQLGDLERDFAEIELDARTDAHANNTSVTHSR
jgi:hypothetical protein